MNNTAQSVAAALVNCIEYSHRNDTVYKRIHADNTMYIQEYHDNIIAGVNITRGYRLAFFAKDASYATRSTVDRWNAILHRCYIRDAFPKHIKEEPRISMRKGDLIYRSDSVCSIPYNTWWTVPLWNVDGSFPMPPNILPSSYRVDVNLSYDDVSLFV